jgi:uncharacterized membrane protein
VKPTALLALPVFWRPWSWRLPLVVVATAVLAYLPYLSVGSGVFGYLWGYIEEEGLTSGRGFNLLLLMERFTGYLPGAARVYIAIVSVLVIGLAIAVAFRRDRSAETAVACLGWVLMVFLVLATPHHPWYFLALVPMLAIHRSATAWILTLACPIVYESVGGTGWPGYDARIAAFTLATVAALAYDGWSLRRKPNPLNLTVGATHEHRDDQPASVP